MRLFSVITIICLLALPGCSSENSELELAAVQLERDLEMYNGVWDKFLKEGDTSVVNADNFTEDVVVVTSEGDLVGIDACRDYYTNFLTGFSEIEWNILDAFGQGDKLVKHWNFKGRHTGEFFGMPATGNYLDLSGTTIVTIRDGKIAKEHDFFDMQSLLDQLSSGADGSVTVDEYRSVN
ncbi:MAG: ester cyclase [Bacteroidetes Order II. Incertae sedis bacterium]|nr:ester cyclase [Bacteroidetes Order II. bacterium]